MTRMELRALLGAGARPAPARDHLGPRPGLERSELGGISEQHSGPVLTVGTVPACTACGYLGHLAENCPKS